MDPRVRPSLARAKGRSSRRARESGAAMFVVAMTIAVLASVGIYALAAAANEVATSANERQSTQTHYLADYGALAIAHDVGPNVDFFLGLITPPNGDSVCQSLPNVPASASIQTRACHDMKSAELAGYGNWVTGSATVPYGGTVPFAAGFPPGSFGTVPLNGDFHVELTDPEQGPPPAGYSDACTIQFTATVWGFTQPVEPLVSGSVGPSFEAEAVEVQRVRFMTTKLKCK